MNYASAYQRNVLGMGCSPFSLGNSLLWCPVLISGEGKVHVGLNILQVMLKNRILKGLENVGNFISGWEPFGKLSLNLGILFKFNGGK